jgi:hypothetical protein
MGWGLFSLFAFNLAAPRSGKREFSDLDVDSLSAC